MRSNSTFALQRLRQWMNCDPQAVRQFRRLVFAACAIAAPHAAESQAVQGLIRDSSGIAIPGVVVSVVDQSGRVLSRVLSGPNGYSIRNTDAGQELQFRRIGFAPFDTAIRSLARIDVRLRQLPQELDPVRVSDSRRCSHRSDQGRALAVWNEARAAMLASAVAQETNRAAATVVRYQRQFGAMSPTVARSDFSQTGRLLRAARSPEDFARSGYRSERDGLEEYYSPDEQTLFDEGFIGRHCFWLSNSRRADSPIVIAFEPDPQIKTVDVEGEIYFRQAPLDIARVDFRFTGLPDDLRRLRPGGFITYSRTPLGVSIATHWQTRIPARLQGVAVSARTDSLGNRRQRLLGPASSSGLHETGALVETIIWTGGISLVTELPSLSGEVTVTDPGPPHEAGLVVRLAGTPYRTTTDATGRFVLRNILPGRHILVAEDTVWKAFGVERVVTARVDVDSGGIRNVKPLEIQPRQKTLQNACGKDARNAIKLLGLNGHSILLGRVQGQEPRSTTLLVSATGSPASVEVVTDSAGNFRVCNVPVGTTIRVSSKADGQPKATLTIRSPVELLTLNR